MQDQLNSAEGLLQFLTGGNLRLWQELSECEWRSGSGIYSHKLSHVIRTSGQVKALIVCYSLDQSRQIDWTFGAARARMEASSLEKLRASYARVSWLFPALPSDAYYVQNIATHPSTRKSGLGRRLMEWAFATALSLGCRTCHLDVDTLTGPVDFYRKLGFEILAETRIPDLRELNPHVRMARTIV